MAELWNNWWQEIINFSLLGIILAIFFKKKLFVPPALKIAGYLILATFVIEIIATYFSIRGINNLFIYHFFVVVELAFFAFFFRKIIEEKTLRLGICIAVFIFALVCLIFMKTIQPVSSYPSFSIMIKDALVSTMAFIFFREVLNNQKYTILEREPLFWFVAGLIIYSIGSFFLEGIMKYAIKNNRPVANKLFYISMILSYIFRIFTIVGFLLVKRTTT